MTKRRTEAVDKKKAIEVLGMIAQDMADDAERFDGQPFNGKTVAEYFGNQGAAIAVLANIVKALIEEDYGDGKSGVLPIL
jgi:hypothetical protein